MRITTKDTIASRKICQDVNISSQIKILGKLRVINLIGQSLDLLPVTTQIKKTTNERYVLLTDLGTEFYFKK